MCKQFKLLLYTFCIVSLVSCTNQTSSNDSNSENLEESEMHANGGTLLKMFPDECPKCEGSTTIECYSCYGSGRVHCRDCGGKGIDNYGRNCLNCSGGGIVSCSPTEECDRCDGHGHGRYDTCDKCGGTGTMPEPNSGWKCIGGCGGTGTKFFKIED